MDIRPQDLPELRAEVLHWQLSHGPAFFDACIRANRMPLRPAGSVHDAAQYLSKAEAQRVLQGELFWVDAQMVALAKTAAESLPEFTLMPEDLPAPFGFMVFGEPAYVSQDPESQRTTFIKAVAWGPLSHPNLPRGGVWASWYSDRELNLGPANDGLISDEEKTLVRQGVPHLVYDLEDAYPFSPDHLPHINPSTGEASKPFDLDRNYLKSELLRVVWLLMQQPLAEATVLDPDRAAKKRLRRAGHEPKPVRVIELRRPKGSSDSGDSDREYQHQWIVRGHWRQHWHPKRQVHRPVWIAPHIKGPEGAPLIGGEKVYAWKR
jgi:hypothetical protein